MTVPRDAAPGGLERILRRDRLLIGLVLAALTALSWVEMCRTGGASAGSAPLPPCCGSRFGIAVAHDFTVSCGIPGHDHPGREIRAEIFRYQAAPYDWELRGRCGFFTDFAYASDT